MNNIEFISQARKLLTEDYKSNHTAEYTQWLSNQQNSWMQPHVIVPFPPFVVSSALAPFKATVSAPTEQDVVAKALELYNQFNAVSNPVVEPVVPLYEPEPEVTLNQPLDIIANSVVEETVVEPVVEETVVEPVETVVPAYTDAIHKIFQPQETVKTEMPTEEPVPTTIEAALSIVPQPAEELAKVKNSGGIFPTVLEKFQAMTFNWSKKNESNVQ